MKENDELKIQGGENDDARAVRRSELLPIYEAMPFSGDIQPLEDLPKEEYIKSDSSAKNSEHRNQERSGDIKRKKIPAFAGLNKMWRRVIIAFAAVLIVGGICAGILSYAAVAGSNEYPVSSVFIRNNETVMLLSNRSESVLSDAQQVRVSDDGMRVYFSTNTSSKTGKFDLRTVDVSRKRDLKKQGSYIDNSVDEGWSINADGSMMTYTKTAELVKTAYLYSAAAGKSYELATGVEEVFLPDGGNVVYFTRRNGDIYSLHRMELGGEPQSVVSGADFVKFCRSDDGYEVLYTVKTGNGTNVSVFSVRDMNAVEELCSDVDEVYINDYVCGGNLYYFTKNKSDINWHDFISDEYYESDLKLQRPVEGDFLIEKGFIFKRKVLDTAAYNAAMSKYELKEKRDEIRAELDSLKLGLAVSEEYTCFVRNSSGTRKLAGGIRLDDVLDTAKVGSPAIVFNKSVIDVENSVSMDALVQIAEKSSVSDAIDYVLETVGSADKSGASCFYASFDGNKVLEYSVGGYEAEKTSFIFASAKTVYYLNGGELYYGEIKFDKLQRGKLIDKNVSNCELRDGYLYYSRLSDSGEAQLCRVSDSEPTKVLADKVYSQFFIDNGILLMRKQSDDSELVALSFYQNGTLLPVDDDARLTGFVYGKNSFAYIKDSDSANHGGDMYICKAQGKPEHCAEKVTDILFTN